jgi:uncharacterized membrane protein YjjP (DUF1212 family)
LKDLLELVKKVSTHIYMGSRKVKSKWKCNFLPKYIIVLHYVAEENHEILTRNSQSEFPFTDILNACWGFCNYSGGNYFIFTYSWLMLTVIFWMSEMVSLTYGRHPFWSLGWGYLLQTFMDFLSHSRQMQD